jgi:hypothetical protein
MSELTKYINDWIINLIQYIEYIVKSDLWLFEDDFLLELKVLKLTNNSDLVQYFDDAEKIMNRIADITDMVIDDKMIIKLKESSYYYDNTHVKIRELADKVQNIYNSIKNDDTVIIDNISSIRDYNHSNLILMKYVQYYKDDNDKIKHLQDHLFDTDQEKYKMSESLHILHKINYLILPMTIIPQKSPYIHTPYSHTAITYNLPSLIDRSEAIKYGPLHTHIQGINKSSYNRFNTIFVKNTNHNIEHTIESTDESAVLYDGCHYKYLTPIHFKNKKKWYPLQGCNIKAYILNQEFENNVLDKMKINLHNYENNTTENTIKLNEHNITKIAFAKLKEFINSNKINNDTIEKELYMAQYFNVINNIKLLRKREYNSIDITLNTMFVKHIIH